MPLRLPGESGNSLSFPDARRPQAGSPGVLIDGGLNSFTRLTARPFIDAKSHETAPGSSTWPAEEALLQRLTSRHTPTFSSKFCRLFWNKPFQLWPEPPRNYTYNMALCAAAHQPVSCGGGANQRAHPVLSRRYSRAVVTLAVAMEFPAP
ncbi:unnamed protein product [Rangifer tarandus platyrhynchus]|uniref:Uncharacterized protein n=1 Tax=Rangifer tarandus platyrhynchus TaxID=3082113 RepID=A0AC59YCB2_RANTA